MHLLAGAGFASVLNSVTANGALVGSNEFNLGEFFAGRSGIVLDSNRGFSGAFQPLALTTIAFTHYFFRSPLFQHHRRAAEKIVWLSIHSKSLLLFHCLKTAQAKKWRKNAFDHIYTERFRKRGFFISANFSFCSPGGGKKHWKIK